MARDDWFRNTEWDEGIEANFKVKLARARDKAQYLRIQATLLAGTHPIVALGLLDQYFGLAQNFDRSQAYGDKAKALLALGNVEGAIEAYEAALAWEVRQPSVLTQAYLEFPLLVAVQGIKARYEQALLILQQNESRLTFPVERFRWYAARALIYQDRGDVIIAKQQARAALDVATEDHSGFRYHPHLGCVNGGYKEIRERLSHIDAHKA